MVFRHETPCIWYRPGPRKTSGLQSDPNIENIGIGICDPEKSSHVFASSPILAIDPYKQFAMSDLSLRRFSYEVSSGNFLRDRTPLAWSSLGSNHGMPLMFCSREPYHKTSHRPNRNCRS
ncbi:unnamed protein product [Allacma fusca]|uniref:Uncharacterized protein n=1 Tax=Allacma fusca TaxID=39272 RepID=A0A8J2KV04_9HEXA|nr:unnamed protein product [Allacma fusca]